MAESNASSTNRPTTTDATVRAASTAERTETRDTSRVQTAERRDANAPSPDHRGIVDRIKDSATAQLTSQKERGSDVLGSIAHAVRSSTQGLRDEKHDTIASYVDNAADQIEHWSQRFREKDVEELLSDVQRFARRQPAIFIGSAFTLGVVSARFLKSSRGRGRYDGDRIKSRRAAPGGTDIGVPSHRDAVGDVPGGAAARTQRS